MLFTPPMGDSRRPAAARRTRSGPLSQAVLLVGNQQDWPPELRARLEGEGYAADAVADISLAPPRLSDGRVRALLVRARPLGASELLVLREIRAKSPRAAIVVFAQALTDPDLKRAFESGATAFLSWPASSEALRHAIESGELPPPPATRPGGDEG